MLKFILENISEYLSLTIIINWNEMLLKDSPDGPDVGGPPVGGPSVGGPLVAGIKNLKQ